ncbi:solute carrier family 2, facilitated glucose transporter member 8-like [Ornithodoros turicata]|uniref:solute carrier family 2, facilitated glucose transporter member 8-like n=1 Tax=Ornithodoros turicata TaxID=34597 RepID=UPI003138EEC2
MAPPGDRDVLLHQQGGGHCRRRLYVAVGAAVLNSVTFGMSFSYSSPALPDIRKRIPFSDVQSDWFGSLHNIGAVLGAPAAGQLLHALGRKNTVLLCTLGYISGYLSIQALPVPELMFVGRLLSGFSSGMTSVAVPVFISEISPPSIRGALNQTYPLTVATGILLSYVLGKWLEYTWLATVCMIPPTLTAVILPWMADSPRWLLQVSRHEDARNALNYYRYPDSAEEELVQISRTIDWYSKSPLSELRQPHILKPFLCTLLAMFLQRFSGVGIVFFYAQDMFKDASSTMDAADSAIIMGTVQVLSVAATVFTVDKCGRRKMLLLSLAVCCVTLSLFGAFYHLKKNASAGFAVDYGWVPLALMCVFVVGYAFGVGSLPWVLLAEMLPLRIKGFATGAAVSFNFLCIALVTAKYHDAIALLGHDGLYWFYAVIMAVGFVLIGKFLPETKGKTLEEIESTFGKRTLEMTDDGQV